MLTSVVWSYAYRPSRDFQLRGWGNLLQLTLIGKDFNLINGGLSALKRFGLGGDWNVWIGAGPARRQHAVIALTSSDSTVDSAAATTLNARGSILLSTPIGTRWGLEVPLVYEHPVAGQGGTEVTSGGNYLRAGLQGRYALGKWKKNNTFSKSAIRLGAGIYQTEIQGKVTQGSFDVENSGIYLDLQYTLGF